MICPKCAVEQPDGRTDCLRCGIVFNKIKPHEDLNAQQENTAPVVTTAAATDGGSWDFVRDLLLSVPPKVNGIVFAGRVIVFAGLVIWGWKFIATPMETNYVGASFMHNINLPFHEAGHFFFRPLGRFLTVLGGSLGQLLMPFICMVALLWQNRDPFGASVGLWWFAESLMDLAPYINDARDLQLILLGGVTGQDVEDYHDWEWILRHLGWLHYDHRLAHAAYNLGIALMLLAFLWGGFILYRQYQNIGD